MAACGGMFVDRIRIYAQAGDGGRGCVSFRREKFVPRGGPDGGDGGRGGDIILRTDTHTDNLANMFYEPIIKAKNGAAGKGKQMYGRAAAAKIVKVPIGTVVYPASAPITAHVNGDVLVSEEPRLAMEPEVAEPVADLTKEGQEFLLCRGGSGGKGNVHFKSSRNRVPMQYTEGEEGERGDFLLELRTIADAGLVGYPNAGKSTLLGKISAAHPKVAAYPFTTLHPSVGVVELDEYRRLRVADIPGLIEGAHRNVGLGHDFLRHITRCNVFFFVLDVAGSEGRHPIEDLQNLRREIDLYDARLSGRPWCVIANKIDLPGAEENVEALKRRFPSIPLAAVSAARGDGMSALKSQLGRWFDDAVAKSKSEFSVQTRSVTLAD
ncbi:MAG: GTPase ObgE [Chthoniobacterales bacterium]